MKRIAIALVALCAAAFAFAADPAEGLWKSISDVKGEEGKVTAFWRISVAPDGTLRGAIVHVPDEPDDKTYKCKKAEFDGKPTMGTYWLYGLKLKEPGVWRNGKIVDVGNDKGDVYGCDVTIKEGGSILNMKGYLSIVGLKIGREQNWQKATEAELAASQAATRKKLGK